MKKKSRWIHKKIMGFYGTKEGVGCTHLALSVANYLHSVEKWKVLYLEMGKFSQLYPLMQQQLVAYEDVILYPYLGVQYLICPTEKEAMRQCGKFDGIVVIDFGVWGETLKKLQGICQRNVVLGGIQRWEHEVYVTCINKNKKRNDMAQMEYYSRQVEGSLQVSFYKEHHVWIRPVPQIADPFALKKKDIVFLEQWLHTK